MLGEIAACARLREVHDALLDSSTRLREEMDERGRLLQVRERPCCTLSGLVTSTPGLDFGTGCDR